MGRVRTAWTQWDILARAKLNPDTECMEWQWSKNEHGYGTLGIRGNKTLAHRVLLGFLIGRPLERGECALHTCDNPGCVSPAHLFVGSHTDNMRDMAAKKRYAPQHGSHNYKAKLTEHDVAQIKAMPMPRGTQKQVAKAYGVNRNTIGAIRAGKFWRHVGG